MPAQSEAQQKAAGAALSAADPGVGARAAPRIDPAHHLRTD